MTRLNHLQESQQRMANGPRNYGCGQRWWNNSTNRIWYYVWTIGWVAFTILGLAIMVKFLIR